MDGGEDKRVGQKNFVPNSPLKFDLFGARKLFTDRLIFHHFSHVPISPRKMSSLKMMYARALIEAPVRTKALTAAVLGMLEELSAQVSVTLSPPMQHAQQSDLPTRQLTCFRA